jgi:hypothetical protein
VVEATLSGRDICPAVENQVWELGCSLPLCACYSLGRGKVDWDERLSRLREIITELLPIEFLGQKSISWRNEKVSSCPFYFFPRKPLEGTEQREGETEREREKKREREKERERERRER